jgi:hypothetical protein
MAPKTFVTEHMCIDWLETVFLVRINELRQKFAYEGRVILLVALHIVRPLAAAPEEPWVRAPVED